MSISSLFFVLFPLERKIWCFLPWDHLCHVKDLWVEEGAKGHFGFWVQHKYGWQNQICDSVTAQAVVSKEHVHGCLCTSRSACQSLDWPLCDLRFIACLTALQVLFFAPCELAPQHKLAKQLMLQGCAPAVEIYSEFGNVVKHLLKLQQGSLTFWLNA